MSITAVVPPPNPNPNVNANALSLFFPSDQPTPLTFSHFLNLPPLLEPISPALAALHLARIRLVLSIPPGVIDQTAWCRVCGGLREALPATLSPPRTGTKKSSPSRKGKMKSKANASPNAKGGKSKIKWAKQCGRCGSEYKRPKPDSETRAFPSARAVRAVRNKRKNGDGAGADPGPNIAPDRDLNSASNSTLPEMGSSSMGGPPIQDTFQDATSIPTPPPQIQSFAMPMPLPYTNSPYQAPTPPPPPPPKYVHNHNLIHVHTSSPHPPTYTQPPPAKNVSPPPKEKSKKRKKSGLARLLAENKEREMGGGSGAGSGGGGWGLD